MSNPTALSTTDQARLVITCQDKAHTYFGGMFGRSDAAAARYLAEILKEGALAAYPYDVLRAAVGEYLTNHPDVLTYTEEQIRLNQQARADEAQIASAKASTLWLAGFPTDALDVIDEAEMLDPDHRVDGRYSWDMLRNVINTQEPTS